MNIVYNKDGYQLTWEKTTGTPYPKVLNGKEIRPGAHYFLFRLTGNGLLKTHTVNSAHPVMTTDVIDGVINIFKKYMK
jgi:hypothetical protein